MSTEENCPEERFLKCKCMCLEGKKTLITASVSYNQELFLYRVRTG